MFAVACATAREFTRPIIISSRQANGECNAGIGAFVVINEEGWIVTALHIINGIKELENSLNEYQEVLKIRQSIEEDTSLKPGKKNALLGRNKIPPHSITNYSALWGGNGDGLDQISAIPEVDLAVGKLRNFDKEKIKHYPFFKDPSKAMEPGTSLCKLGFPFLSIKPVYLEEKKIFELPPESLPPVFFPLEGILTRFAEVGNHAGNYPLKFIETSSPGLMGQSGGPTFDIHGNIWAIQSQTKHLPLGFGNNHKGKSRETEHLQNQYLHVGLGIHCETIIGHLKARSISFQMASV